MTPSNNKNITPSQMEPSLAKQASNIKWLVLNELEAAFCKGVLQGHNDNKPTKGQCPICKDFGAFLGHADLLSITESFVKCMNCQSLINKKFLTE
jgi:hypothetical protein